MNPRPLYTWGRFDYASFRVRWSKGLLTKGGLGVWGGYWVLPMKGRGLRERSLMGRAHPSGATENVCACACVCACPCRCACPCVCGRGVGVRMGCARSGHAFWISSLSQTKNPRLTMHARRRPPQTCARSAVQVAHDPRPHRMLGLQCASLTRPTPRRAGQRSRRAREARASSCGPSERASAHSCPSAGPGCSGAPPCPPTQGSPATRRR